MDLHPLVITVLIDLERLAWRCCSSRPAVINAQFCLQLLEAVNACLARLSNRYLSPEQCTQ
eukprot:CAMPEP_0179028182 /NCGR_PEP_ID=MMETSP0796-20121207/9416_1 /TAXON_ID=73915 /ORGANISM="Pyrodinium bahamense, Strain pbaha01" /LENGTH=60 /DNA_ID=CAMNT_0020724321 /DNA_START=443 /DNA_END=625 /DNA_ORIENTATION=+